jgi:hypothetical protein
LRHFPPKKKKSMWPEIGRKSMDQVLAENLQLQSKYHEVSQKHLARLQRVHFLNFIRYI